MAKKPKLTQTQTFKNTFDILTILGPGVALLGANNLVAVSLALLKEIYLCEHGL